MDPLAIIKQYESRLKDVEMKLEAVMKDLKVTTEYTPESYKIVPCEDEGGDS